MYTSIRAKALSRAKVSCPLLEATLVNKGEGSVKGKGFLPAA
jgi:hypothetical protein